MEVYFTSDRTDTVAEELIGQRVSGRVRGEESSLGQATMRYPREHS